MVKKVAILIIAAGAYAVGFWPTSWVRRAVLKAFGNPPYEGVWILIPHVFLYTTLSAVTCLVLWLALGGAIALPFASRPLARALLVAVPLLCAAAGAVALLKPF